MKKKMIALLMSVTMIMTCLSACGGKEETADSTTKGDTTTEVFAEGESEKNSCTITFWYTYGDAEEEILLNKVMPLWNELHPEITVECVRQDSSQYDEMVVISFGTGQGPDVARIDITNTAEFAAQGGLVALNNYSDFEGLSENYIV